MTCCEYPGCILSACRRRIDTRRKAEEWGWIYVCHDHLDKPLPDLEVDTTDDKLDMRVMALVAGKVTMYWSPHELADELEEATRDVVESIQRQRLKLQAGRIVRPSHAPPQQEANVPTHDHDEPPEFDRRKDESLRDYTIRLVQAHPGLSAREYNARARRKVSPRLSALVKSGHLDVNRTTGTARYYPVEELTQVSVQMKPEVQEKAIKPPEKLTRESDHAGIHLSTSWEHVVDDLQRIIDTADAKREKLVRELSRLDHDVNAANAALAGLQAIISGPNPGGSRD